MFTRLLTSCLLLCLSASQALGQESAEKLKEVEQQIEIKTRELSALKQQAAALKGEAAERPSATASQTPKVYRSTAELLAAMPADSYPEPGEDREPERVVAKRWLFANVVGKTIELQAPVTKVSISSHNPEVPFAVSLEIDYPEIKSQNTIPSFSFLAWGGEAKLGEQEVETRLTYQWDQLQGLVSPRFGADDRLARQIREKKGQEVTIQAKIVKAGFYYQGNQLLLAVSATPLTIDEFRVMAKEAERRR